MTQLITLQLPERGSFFPPHKQLLNRKSDLVQCKVSIASYMHPHLVCLHIWQCQEQIISSCSEQQLCHQDDIPLISCWSLVSSENATKHLLTDLHPTQWHYISLVKYSLSLPTCQLWPLTSDINKASSSSCCSLAPFSFRDSFSVDIRDMPVPL